MKVVLIFLILALAAYVQADTSCVCGSLQTSSCSKGPLSSKHTTPNNQYLPSNPRNSNFGPYLSCVTNDFLNAVVGFLPESVAVNPKFLNPNDWDPNVHFNFTTLAIQNRIVDSNGNPITSNFKAYINVTFFYEGAGYHNIFGYFTYTLDSNGNPTVTSEVPLFPDVSMWDGGCLQTGTSIDIGPFKQGDNVGWIVWPNAANGANLRKYYSVASLNPPAPDDVHFFVFSLQNKYVIGTEDVVIQNSDHDYNDIVFQFTTTAGADPVDVPVFDCTPSCVSGQGICNKTKLRCDCLASASAYYSGADCGTVTPCSPTCAVGTCGSTGQCVCNQAKYNSACNGCANGLYNFPTCAPCKDSACCGSDKKICTVASDGRGVQCTDPVPPPAPTPVCLTKPFGDASDYSVFVLGDLTASFSDIQGAIGAGGDVSLNQYSLGEAFADPDNDYPSCSSIGSSKYVAVAAGNFNWQVGNARVGKIAVGGTNNISSSVLAGLSFDCLPVTQALPVSFKDSFRFLDALSSQLAGIAQNGQWGNSGSGSKNVLSLSAPTNDKLAAANQIMVFNIGADSLAAANAVQLFNFDSCSFKVIVINVLPTSGSSNSWTFKDTSFDTLVSGSQAAISNKIIWNFWNSGFDTLSIQSIALPGTVLAPKSNVKANNGLIIGQVYAASFEGTIQVNAPSAAGPCIMSNFVDVTKFDNFVCPPCAGGAVASTKNCKCSCPQTCPQPNMIPDPNGDCTCHCPFDSTCVLGQDPVTCKCFGSGTPANTGSGSCVNNWPAWVNDFQIVTENDLTLKSTRTGGRLAAGGDLNLKRIAVGDQLSNVNHLLCTETSGLTVPGVVLGAGAITLGSGKVYGNILAGGSLQCKSYYLLTNVYQATCSAPLNFGDLVGSGKSIDFNDAFNQLQAASNIIADPTKVPSTGQAYFAYDVLTLFGYGNALEVFRVDTNTLASARRIDVVNVAATATVIIDISGGRNDDVMISNAGLSALGGFAQNLLWNAANTRSFQFKNVALPGLILAPRADITNPVGALTGGAFVSSFSARGNVGINWPFAPKQNWGGCLPNLSQAGSCSTSCPAGTRRLSVTDCSCTAVVSVGFGNSDVFTFPNGAVVTYRIGLGNFNNSRPPTSVTFQFTNSASCPIQYNKDKNIFNIFTLQKVSSSGGSGSAATTLVYQTPNYAGFTAANLAFQVVYEGTNGACSSIPTPTITSVSYDPIH